MSSPASSQRLRSVSRKPSGGTREPALPCTGSTITQPASPGSGPGSSPYARLCTGSGSHAANGSRNPSKPGAPSAGSPVPWEAPSKAPRPLRAGPGDGPGGRFRNRPRHRRILLQPPQRVAVPVLAEGDVDAQPVSLRHQLVAPLLAHAEQHLELVLGRPETPARDPRERLADQPLVVRRHTDIALGVEQRVEAAEEVRAHRL